MAKTGPLEETRSPQVQTDSGLKNMHLGVVGHQVRFLRMRALLINFTPGCVVSAHASMSILDRHVGDVHLAAYEHFFGKPEIDYDYSCLREEMEYAKSMTQSVFDKFPPRAGVRKSKTRVAAH